MSRRSVLRTVGTLGIAAGLAGQASASETLERRVVGTTSAAGARAVKGRAARVVREIDLGERGHVVVGEFPKEAAVEVEGRSDVKYVEPDVRLEVLGEPERAGTEATVEEQLTPWGVERVGADAAHDQGFTGRGSHVAIVDTGIDSDHPDLRGNLGEGYAVVESDDGRRDWDDDHDHGTHCAGIAGAVPNDSGVVGVAPETTLHAVKVISADGRGSASSIAEGLRWVADRGYDVASLSLGATSPSTTIHDAVKYCVERGTLVVAAAGNERPDEKVVHYPAAFPEAIAVGATAPDDDMADFSLTGDPLEIAAPGVRIPSTVIGGYERYNGTSMATPHVAGAAGVLSATGMSMSEVRRRLASTAEDIGHDQDEMGNGLLNLDAAVSGTGGGGDEPAEGLAVATRGAESVSETTATLTGELTDLGEQEAATVGFDYWAAGDESATRESVTVGERDGTGTYSAPVEGLDSDTTYVFVATADAGDTSDTGRERDFTTAARPTDQFTIETGAARDVDEDEAELVGYLTSIDGVEEVVVGFEYWEESADPATATYVEDGDEDDPDEFDEDAEDLTPGTAYAFRAVGRANGVAVRGETATFVTAGGNANGGEEPDTAIAVSTGSPTDLDDDDAEMTGVLTQLQGTEEVVVGFEYWEKGGGSPTYVEADEVDEPETFDEDADDLQPETTYVYRAVATAADGTEATGETVEFTTLAD